MRISLFGHGSVWVILLGHRLVGFVPCTVSNCPMQANHQRLSLFLLHTNGECAMQAVPCTVSNCPIQPHLKPISLRIGAGPSLSRPRLVQDHLSLMQDSLSLGWESLTMDVLSLDMGYFSLCFYCAGRVLVCTCDPRHLVTRSLSK